MLNHWLTLRVTHYAPDKDGLLLDALEPVMQVLRRSGQVHHHVTQRHWLHGPHLRVHLSCLPACQPLVQHTLAATLRTFLEAHPSRLALTADEYLKRYAAVGDVEITGEPLLPLLKDNTWSVEPLLFRGDMYGCEHAAVTALQFLEEAQPTFLALMQRTRGQPAARTAELVKVMFVFSAAFASSHSARRQATGAAAYSFRSHAEAYFFGLGAAGEPLRQDFMRRWDCHQEGLTQGLEQILEGNVPPELQAWHDLIQRFNARLQDSLNRQTLHLITADDMRARARLAGHPDGDAPPQRSPWHEGFDDPSSRVYQRMQQSDVQARRFLVNLMYDRFVLTGVRAIDRLFLCFLVAETVERAVYGAPWTLERLQRSWQTSPQA